MKSESAEAPKIILDLCGGTGAWSKPYTTRGGYSVTVVTLPRYNMFDIRLEGGFVKLWDNIDKKEIEIRASEVYGILAAPTCTMFSLARTTAKTERDFEGGLKLVQKCLSVIWYCRQQKASKLKFWALENPMGYLRQFLGRPPLVFSPNDYGDNYTKKTDLWGFYNIPTMRRRELTEEEKLKCAINNRDLPQLPDDYIMPEGWNAKAARRSMTSAHFAEAFYKANK